MPLLTIMAFNIPPYAQPQGVCLIVQTISGEVHGFLNASTPLVGRLLAVLYADPPLGCGKLNSEDELSCTRNVNAVNNQTTLFQPYW